MCRSMIKREKTTTTTATYLCVMEKYVLISPLHRWIKSTGIEDSFDKLQIFQCEWVCFSVARLSHSFAPSTKPLFRLVEIEFCWIFQARHSISLPSLLLPHIIFSLRSLYKIATINAGCLSYSATYLYLTNISGIDEQANERMRERAKEEKENGRRTDAIGYDDKNVGSLHETGNKIFEI